MAKKCRGFPNPDLGLPWNIGKQLLAVATYLRQDSQLVMLPSGRALEEGD